VPEDHGASPAGTPPVTDSPAGTATSSSRSTEVRAPMVSPGLRTACGTGPGHGAVPGGRRSDASSCRASATACALLPRERCRPAAAAARSGSPVQTGLPHCIPPPSGRRARRRHSAPALRARSAQPATWCCVPAAPRPLGNGSSRLAGTGRSIPENGCTFCPPLLPHDARSQPRRGSAPARPQRQVRARSPGGAAAPGCAASPWPP
jgi:hypothetical protein